MGNICRSPTAESVFRAHALRAGVHDRLVIASAGIGDWHVGQPPDDRAILHARRRGYDLSRLRARQVTRDDFARFKRDARIAWNKSMDFSGRIPGFLNIVTPPEDRPPGERLDDRSADFQRLLIIVGQVIAHA